VPQTAENFMYELCVEHGFDYGDMDQFFMALEDRSGRKGRPLNTMELKGILDAITGGDTAGAFREAGIPLAAAGGSD